MDFALTVNETRRTIKPGSLVIVFLSHDELSYVYAVPGEILNNKWGSFHHNDLIGREFGCTWQSKFSNGWVHALSPTPELWARALNHRTQIVHELDAATVVFHLGLRPGHVVLESGTGSGALSTTIMRTVAPHGHLHTFEFNAGRVEAATREFDRNGLAHLCTVRHRDVCGKAPVTLASPSSSDAAADTSTAASTEDTSKASNSSSSSSSGVAAEDLPAGFDPIPDGTADAVFLDVPEPWLAVPEASRCLKPSRKFASYSPCIEQVMKTCAALRANGFHSIRTLETRLKTYDVAKQAWPVPDFGQATPPGLDLGQPVATPGAAVNIPSTGGAAAAGTNGFTTGPAGETTGDSNGVDEKETAAGKKRARDAEPVDENTGTDLGVSSSHKLGTPADFSSVGEEWLLARPNVSMRGHTAFLTFATRSSKEVGDSKPLQPVASSTTGTSSSKNGGNS